MMEFIHKAKAEKLRTKLIQDQSEAYRVKTKAARVRRQERVEAKKEIMSIPAEAPKAITPKAVAPKAIAPKAEVPAIAPVKAATAPVSKPTKSKK